MTEPTTALTANDTANRGPWFSVVILTLITVLAFANAAHDDLVYDDMVFMGPDRIVEIETLGHAFYRDVWGNDKPGRGFYRPLQMIGFELQTRWFGDWKQGYHIVNISLHIVATLLLFGFLRFLLRLRGASGRLLELSALVAAIVFAIHPIHTETVNSVFNGSSIVVSICAIAGLWWLLARLDDQPLSAWLGFGLFYCIGILFKESALSMPGIAVAMIVLLTPGSLGERIKRFLPVFFMLLPIAAYFYLRSKALAGSEYSGDEMRVMMEATTLPGEQTPYWLVSVIAQAFRTMVWPWPLQLYYWHLSGPALVAGIAAVGALLIGSVVLYFRRHPSLAVGLSFFLIAFLPASRIVSTDGSIPHLAERYLYYPSIGFAIVLAALVLALAKRFGPRLVAVIFLPLVLLGAAVTWERNQDWSDDLMLFQTEYNLGNRHLSTIRVLISALWAENQKIRILDICEENRDSFHRSASFANTCASIYQETGRPDDAIFALSEVAERDDIWLRAGLTLGNLLIKQGRKQEGADRYAYIINRLEEPAKKEFFKGHLYLQLYPQSRKYLEIAKRHMQTALRLDPNITEAQEFIRRIDAALNPTEQNMHETMKPLEDMDVPGVEKNADPTKG